jgi:hypothetical protein
MTEKAVGITKAAIAGAFFGSAVGMMSVPKNKNNKKHSVMSDVSGTLRIVGVAMQDISNLLRK